MLPGIIGCMQANEVLKIILGIGKVLSEKILYYNALTLQTSTLKISKNEAAFATILKEKINVSKKVITTNCQHEIKEVSIHDILLKENIQIIDVRELYEQPKINNLNITQIPLSELEKNLNKIDLKKDVFLFCQSGVRSKKALSILKTLNINNCFNIKEGVSTINNILNNRSSLKKEQLKP